jgi:hypothetical protein
VEADGEVVQLKRNEVLLRAAVEMLAQRVRQTEEVAAADGAFLDEVLADYKETTSRFQLILDAIPSA